MKQWKYFKSWLLMKVRIFLYQKKVFTGDYAENYMAIKRFMSESDIIVFHYESEDVKPGVVEDGLPEEEKLRIIADQKKYFKKKLGKQKVGVLYYVPNNSFYKWVGFRKRKVHYMFSPR